MLVIDFLQLSQDLRRQTPFFYHTPTEKWACQSITVTTINEQDCLVIKMVARPKSLQQWELAVLLNKPEYLTMPIYLAVADELVAVYGFRMTQGEAWLN